MLMNLVHRPWEPMYLEGKAVEEGRAIEEVETATLVRSLLQQGEEVPPGLRQAIVARGSEAVGPLLEILENPELDSAESPGEGFAPEHAVDLLVALRAHEAIGPMLRVLEQTERRTPLYEKLTLGLQKLGPVVAAATRELLAETEKSRRALLEVLSGCGARDEHIFQTLCAELESGDTELAARCLARYGDPRAVEPLQRALEVWELRPPGPLSNHAVIELTAAIEELGGTLEPEHQAKLEQVHRQREQYWGAFRRLLHPQPRSRSDRPGRNEPCWCGSGVKYKKCHLASDRREGR
jgi:hypothetical protein